MNKLSLSIPGVILVLSLIGSFALTAYGQTDASAAAARAYKEKNYSEFLRNVQELSKQQPHNVWITEFLARAFALNQMDQQALETLRALAQMGVAVDLTHADLASLKGKADFEQLRPAFERNAAPTVRSRVASTLAEKDLIPEGITYDAATGHFYVSSIYRRKIVRLTKTGTVEDFTSPGQDGLLNVLGMKVEAKRRILWACTFSGPRDGDRNGGVALFKDVYSPKTSRGRLPAVIFVHGGRIPPSLLTTPKTGRFMFPSVSWSQSPGSLVSLSNHRFHTWESLADSQTDVMDAIKYVRDQAATFAVDPERIVLWTVSTGGIFLSRPLQERPPYLKSIIAYYSQMDLQSARASAPASVSDETFSRSMAVMLTEG
jgi:acetyl esterase/lipase